MSNSVAAGCITGGAIGLRGEHVDQLFMCCLWVIFLITSLHLFPLPQLIHTSAGVTAAVAGCGGFAAFSVAIDYFFKYR